MWVKVCITPRYIDWNMGITVYLERQNLFSLRFAWYGGILFALSFIRWGCHYDLATWCCEISFGIWFEMDLLMQTSLFYFTLPPQVRFIEISLLSDFIMRQSSIFKNILYILATCARSGIVKAKQKKINDAKKNSTETAQSVCNKCWKWHKQIWGNRNSFGSALTLSNSLLQRHVCAICFSLISQWSILFYRASLPQFIEELLLLQTPGNHCFYIGVFPWPQQ